MKVWQEFHCPRCQGFIRLKLDLGLKKVRIYFTCPNCGRKHERFIHDGVILENGRDNQYGKNTLEIVVPKSAYSKNSILNRPRTNNESRESVALEPSNVAERHPSAVQYFQERWREMFGRPE